MAVQTRGAAGLCGQLRADDDGYDHDDDDDDGGGCDDLFSSLAPWLVFRFLSFFFFFDESLEALDSCDHSSNQLRQWGP